MNAGQLQKFGARVARKKEKVFAGAETQPITIITLGEPAHKFTVTAAPPASRDNAQLREAGFVKEVDATLRVRRDQIPAPAGAPEKGWRVQVGKDGSQRIYIVDDIVDNPASPEWVMGLV